MLISPLSGKTIGAPDGDFVIAAWSDEGCPAEGPMPIAPLHFHHECDEAWYVLEGTLCVQSGDEVITVPAGACAYVRRGTAHTYWNPNPAPVQYLLLMTAKTHRLIEAIHASPDRSLNAIKQLFLDHDAELV